MQTIRFILIQVLAAVALLLCGCSAPHSNPATLVSPATSAAPVSPGATVGDTVYINFEHDRFFPAAVTIPAGTTVVWQVSEDYIHHWVVCDAVPFRGWFYEWFPFKYVFDEPGTYHYYDGANPGIAIGTVIVY
jgi:plastocyanin